MTRTPRACVQTLCDDICGYRLARYEIWRVPQFAYPCYHNLEFQTEPNINTIATAYIF